MAFVYSPSVFAGIITSLGISNAYLQLSQAGTAVSGLSQLQDSRNTIADSLADNSITGTDFDASNTLAAALRTAEKNAPTEVATNYDTTLAALDTYFTTVAGSNLRTYWNSKTSNQTTTFTDNFRSYFRRVKSDELIVKLYSITMPSGGNTTSFASIASTTNMVPALFEVRTDSAIGTSFIANFTCVKTTGGTDLVSLEIPAGTGVSTYFSIGGTQKYLFMSAFSGTGTSGDTISLWVR
jgi:hypothetical protein